MNVLRQASTLSRVIAAAMALLIATLGYPTEVLAKEAAAAVDEITKAARVTKPAKAINPIGPLERANKHQLQVRKASLGVDPSDVQIRMAHLFEEPMVPLSLPAVAGENAALVKAVEAFKGKGDNEDLSDLRAFLAAYSKSRWTAALHLNLGLLELHNGYVSDALSDLKVAWNQSKSETGQIQRLMAQRAVSELLILEARLGMRDELQAGLNELGARPMLGSSRERVDGAIEGLSSMQHSEKMAYRCGPLALNTILNLNKKVKERDPRLAGFVSTSRGTSLAEVKEWADKLGMHMIAAKRTAGAAIPTPSIMHWSVGHFTCVSEQKKGRFHVQDPTFERLGSLWISSKAIDTESDGYFLVPDGQLPQGWQQVSQTEAANVWGKGDSVGAYNAKGPGTPKTCMGTSCGDSCEGLAQAKAYSLSTDLNIMDQPLGYDQPIGESIDFLANFNQREQGQPSNWPTSNLGPNWSLNWVSWVSVDASGNATVHARGGGIEDYPYTNPDNVSSPFPPALMSQAQLIIPVTGVYQRLSPDGSVEVYGLADGTGNYYLTAVLDPQGNQVSINYDASFRVTTVVDANSNASTFSYFSNTVGNPGYYVISTITDPFSRSCSFSFDSTYTLLLTITDAVGVVSKFGYDSTGSSIATLSTAYGVTQFSTYTPTGPWARQPRGVRFTFPDGTSSILENWIGHPKASYFWDREAISLYPNDPANHIYAHSQITQWAYMPNGSALLSPCPSWTRNPLESQVDFIYTISQGTVGDSSQPVSVSQILAGGQTQIADFSGSVTAGDVISISIFNVGLPIGQYTVSYKAQSTDTFESIASALAATMNADTTLQGIGLTATASGNSIQLVTTSVFYTSYQGTSSGDSELIDFHVVNNPQPTSATLSGTVTTGDVISVVIVNRTLPNKQVRKSYTVVGGDTTTTIAAALASAINADTTLADAHITASSLGAVLTFQSNSFAGTSYNASSNGGTEVVTMSGNVLSQRLFDYNSFGHVTRSIDAVGRTFSYRYAANDVDLLELRETQAADNFLLGKWQYGNQHVPTSYMDGSGRSWQFLYNVFGERTQSTDPLSGVTTYTYTATNTATIGGTVAASKTPSITIIDPALSGGQKTISYTTSAGDTTTIVATGLKNNINGDASLQALGVSATSSGAVVTIKSSSVNKTTFSGAGSGAITVTLGTANYGFLTAVKGPLQQLDITSFSWNLNGTLASTTDSEGYTLSYQYDALNRPTVTTYPDGTTEQTKYRNSDAVLMTDRLGRATQRAFDNMDQLVFEVDPLGRKTQYAWCDCGSLATLTDAAGHSTTWSHDLQGRVTQKTFADSTATSYLYEPNTSRLSRRNDALGQHTDYTYNPDNTLLKVAYSSVVNPTSDVSYTWDPQFSRLRKVENGWGNYQYAYNPYISDPFGTPTTGGGRLQQIINSVIPNSAITYTYDALGRTTNRSINGSSNSITWSYDAMSRVTQEVNALGTFGYTYLDNTSPNSKGVTRLASISYPNGQVTNFSWFDNNRDQRLKEISNLDPSSLVLSQFDYSFDSAGQITRWQQQQKTLHQNFALDYDAAGQLTMATAGRGALPPPYANQSFYAYDSAANRTAVQTSQVQNILVGGSKTTGDVLTVTVNDSGLTGGAQAVNYTVLAGDSLTTIATNLAATITADSSLQALGIDAVSTGTTVTLRSKSPNITSYATSLSGSATETLVTGINNSIWNISVGGTSHNGDVLQVIVRDPALSGGSTTASYTVSGSPTLSAIATSLASAINGGTGLSALGVTAVANNTVITVKSTSQNVTSYAPSVSGAGATVTLSAGPSMNGSITALIGGTITNTDKVNILISDAGISGGTKTITKNVTGTDTTTTIATALASSINGDAALQAIGVTASSSGAKLTFTSVSTNATTYGSSTSNSGGTALGTETVLVGLPANGTTTASIAGTVASGDQFTLTVFDAALSGGSIAKTVTGVTTPNAVASGLASAINADSNLSAAGVTASAAIPTTSVSVVNISSTSNNATTYTFARTGSATIALSKNVGISQASFNNVNELTAISAGGSARFQGTTDRPVQPVTINSNPMSMPTTQSFLGKASLSSGANSVSVSATAGGGGTPTTNSYKLNAVGANSTTLTFDANGNMTSDGTNSYSWDGENRLVQITYPGSGNNSQFVYDPLDLNVKIEERAGGSLTTTKNFVWCSATRCEDRDAGGAPTHKYFSFGRQTSGNSYYYSLDHLGSVREVLDNSGILQVAYTFDSFGRASKLQGTADNDYQFASCYSHSRSGLLLTAFRAYRPESGIWLSRDPMGESADGPNLYSYTRNSPINFTDSLGLQSSGIGAAASVAARTLRGGNGGAFDPYLNPYPVPGPIWDPRSGPWPPRGYKWVPRPGYQECATRALQTYFDCIADVRRQLEIAPPHRRPTPKRPNPRPTPNPSCRPQEPGRPPMPPERRPRRRTFRECDDDFLEDVRRCGVSGYWVLDNEA